MKNFRVIYFEEDMDLLKLKYILTNLPLINTEKLLIFLRRKSKTYLNNTDLSKFYNKIIDYLDEHDVFYLSNHGDSCEKSILVGEWKDVKIEKSFSPNGFEAIASTHKKWLNIIELLENQEDTDLSKKMNTLVVRNKINAITSWPRIYHSEKRNYCRVDKVFAGEELNKMSYFYFLFGIVIFIMFCIKSYYYKNEKINT